MRFIIQKFGGTSLVSQELREKVAARAIAAREEGVTPVLVVSAIGRVNDPFATDTLVNFARQVHREIESREMDMLMSCGEIISGVIMAGTFQKLGYPSVFLSGPQAGIVTDNSFSDARILKIKPENIIRHAREGKIVVVAGFQGMTEDGEITTLGRGGSDTTAAALGVALDAEFVDIYTDVEGIMTADPRIVENARIREVVTYDEICHLAHEGAKVVHPRAVEIVMQKNIPMRVKCTFSNAPGTLVTSTGEVFKGTIDITRDRTITGITQIPNLTQFRISMDNGSGGLTVKRRLFNSLALAGISLDFINVYPDRVVFTVRGDMAQKVLQVLETTGINNVEYTDGCSKVAAVGAGMTGLPGIMAAIVDALTREEIQILQSNDSHTTIWLLVKREDMEKAVRALHRRFALAD
ncbi:aspartokinase [Desulfocucumis palustris]|uniref:Aspartokinase n=1 Tax=Desulfocucumis palustris TaxID=1898651 RepID=A0A2L2XJU3_9FIRM|nr:aspartate kinase [Desulfocucumis palustris]GBF34191.1 aspartokinase [Desulfocucumis palustris]